MSLSGNDSPSKIDNSYSHVGETGGSLYNSLLISRRKFSSVPAEIMYLPGM